MIAVSIDREAAAVLNIENLFTSVYQARENAQIEIDLQNQKMAVESVSAAEILIQRFACYTTTLHIFSFFYQQWDSKARRKFASDSSLISTYIHARTRLHDYDAECAYAHMCCTWILHYMCIPSLLCHFIGYSTPHDVVPLFIPSPNSNDSTVYSIERRQTEHSFDSDALCVSRLPRLPHEFL